MSLWSRAAAQARQRELDQLRSEVAALAQQQAGLRAAAAGAASELAVQRADAEAAAARAERAGAELAAVRDTQAALTLQARALGRAEPPAQAARRLSGRSAHSAAAAQAVSHIR